jgi:hypothetical protein
MTLLEQVLKDQEPAVRAEILAIAKASKLADNDPIFSLMLAIGAVQVLVLRAPNDLKQTYNNCHMQVLNELREYEQAAARGVEQQISKAAHELINKARASVTEPTWRTFLLVGCMTLSIFGTGWWTGKTMGEEYRAAARSQGQLTPLEQNALDWATSDEGEYAQKLLRWNDSLIGGTCQSEVKDIGIRMQYGSAIARDGFCFVWVVPPEQRNLKQK